MMKKIVFTITIFILIISSVTLFFALRDVNTEQDRLTSDLQYRTTLLADNLKQQIESSVPTGAQYVQDTVSRFVSDQRIAGILVYDNTGHVMASAPAGLVYATNTMNGLASNAMDGDKIYTDFESVAAKRIYFFVVPLHKETTVIGSLAIIQNAGFISDQIAAIWKANILRFGIQMSLLLIAGILFLRFVIYMPVKTIVEGLQILRRTQPENRKLRTLPDTFFFRPLTAEINRFHQSLVEARLSARREARLRIEKEESPWTEERLHEYTKQIIKDRSLVVASNREPYIHTRQGNAITYYTPPSGMVTAIEPMIEACGGLWIAASTGNADRISADKKGKLEVPPEDPRYTLKRIWINPEEYTRYYNGFSNEGLWPLCHMAHTRPVFREEDWRMYESVNIAFAKSILEEIKHRNKPIIFVQDYHLALVPSLIKQSRPDSTIGLFWHIPWPNPEAFGICPYRKEILDGMLGADLIGFHTQLHCNNFIETVGRELESLIDWEQFTVTRNTRRTLIQPFPISIAEPDAGFVTSAERRSILHGIGIPNVKYILIGVDRLDYTKGVQERLLAIEELLTRHPSYISNLVFLQLSSPSRTEIPAYQEYGKRIQEEVDRINRRFQTNGWKPIVLLSKHHTHQDINRYFRIANACLVTSLHDGMNLVAKEYIAARSDERGVLILSKFAGSSRELKDAIIVNPYDIHEVAQSIRHAIQMSDIDQHRQMRRLRTVVREHNIYRWSADILKALVTI